MGVARSMICHPNGCEDFSFCISRPQKLTAKSAAGPNRLRFSHADDPSGLHCKSDSARSSAIDLTWKRGKNYTLIPQIPRLNRAAGAPPLNLNT